MDVDYSKYFPMREYYEKVVMPLNTKFKKSKGDKLVCCLHEDTDPSLGIISSKKKGELFHCFGCNSWGDILVLHKRVSLKYFSKSIDDELCKRELCKIFGVDYNSLPKEDYVIDNVRDKDIRKELALREALDKFDISDFRSSFIRGKIEGKGVDYFNTLLITMVSESMKLKD